MVIARWAGWRASGAYGIMAKALTESAQPARQTFIALWSDRTAAEWSSKASRLNGLSQSPSRSVAKHAHVVVEGVERSLDVG